MPRLKVETVPFSLLESAEADSWAEIQGQASPALRERFDVEVSRIAGAVVITAPKSDMLAINRAWLPGSRANITAETMAAISEHARDRGIPQILIHMPDWARPADLAIEGWNAITPLIKFYQRAASRPTYSRLRVATIGPADRGLFGEIAARGNEAPAFMADGFNSTVGLPGWRHYLAFDDDTPIAAAALRLHETVGWLCFAGTLPEHRGKGAQRALIAQRISDAAAAGCAWVTCESLPDRPKNPSVSRMNMVACGFVAAYERPSYLVRLS
jgi:GNAT superfamily N-acetyltransferase